MKRFRYFDGISTKAILKTGMAVVTIIWIATAYANGELPQDATVTVAPLTRAMWNQGKHYNLMCPVTTSGGNDGRMWAGCTAVATAILLDHYRWPLQGTGDTTYEEQYWPANTVNQRARFDSEYDWDAIRDSYGHVVSARESLAIGTLMSDVGAVLNMNYGANGSSTQFINVPYALGRNFFFDTSYTPKISDFSDANIVAIIAQLKEGHPIPCSGAANASGVGHTYVCDGHALTSASHGAVTNLFHFNFGWGGKNNGWYPLDAVFTSAIPGEAATSQRVDEMYLHVYPEKEPQFARSPALIASALTSRWAIATCWTNSLVGQTLERQRLSEVTVDESILPSDWTMHLMSGDPLGWIVGDTTVSGRIYSFWGSNNWPGMDNALCSTKSVAISEATSITITYRAIKLPDGVSLRLSTAVYDNGVGEWSDRDPDTFEYLPTLATLPCGTSTSSLTSRTLTLSGADLVTALGGASADVHLAIGVYDPNWIGTTFAANTEVFRLESFVVSGSAYDWQTVETRELELSARSAAFADLDSGRHRLKLITDYGETAVTGMTEVVVSETERVPSVRVAETNATSVVFEIGDAENFSCGFERQSNALAGGFSCSGNRVTYTFNSPVAALGTHWLTLTVTNNASRLISKFVHIVNPPEDHPLCAYTERTLEAALARGLSENKPVLLLSTGDPEADKFSSVSEFLASNRVVAAVADKYILVEASGVIAEDAALVKEYWRQQPVALGMTPNPYDPTRYGYAIIIDPRQPGQPVPCSPTAYGGLNSQRDFAFMSVAQLVVDPLVKFLEQDFGLSAAPEILGIRVGDQVEVTVGSTSGESYTLLRVDDAAKIAKGLKAASADWSTTAVADGDRLTLVDPAPPPTKAFYLVVRE